LPEDVEDVDFQFLLHLQQKKGDTPNRVLILNSYGIFLSHKGKLKEAEAAFSEAITLDSTDVLAYINSGNLYDQQKKYTKAEYYYLRAVKLEPNNALAHYNLGLLYEALNKKELARAELRKAMELDPEDKDAPREYQALAPEDQP
jgi:tetratricopeptide (TPR) repeat protein